MNKALKIFLIVVAALLVLLIAAGFVVGNFMYNVALVPSTDKTKVFSSDNNVMEMPDNISEGYIKLREASDEWFSDEIIEDDYITSFDGLKLHGNVIKNEGSQKWAIVCHGYLSQGKQMSFSAYHFFNEGYNVLMPDARGSGESEGDYVGMGWDDRLDIVRWIDKIVEEDSDAQIILYGVSMGGATVMMTAGEDLPSNVKAIVEDCGYTSVWDEFAYELKEIFNLPSFPIMHFSSVVTRVRAGFWLSEASAVEQLKKTEKPILFIHGDEDTFVPSFMLDIAYEASNAPKEKIEVEGAGHGMSAAVLGDEYWEQVDKFIGKYMD